ncbi:GNAT family N-acetyltransferase [Salimicrobium sp. PL1-032A]|uniref:GNAT family N-acetyltransferase n=1 Tax=Salimicrobium sp. PL1-032A TaxID=3095364 RepID=UPI003260DF9E
MDDNKEIRLTLYWTGSIPDKGISDFISVHREVFGSDFDESAFAHKYRDNIYGESAILLAYHEERCVGIRVFWRNDLDGRKAFQPCDTAVLDTYRGEGLFRKMTMRALDEFSEEVALYNFPNENSLAAYEKMGWSGWEWKAKKRSKIFNPFKDRIDEISDAYLRWITEGDAVNRNLYHCRINRKRYLLKKYRFNMYFILGRIHDEEGYRKRLPKASFPICFSYTDHGYIGNGVNVFTNNVPADEDIPVYKIDTLLNRS